MRLLSYIKTPLLQSKPSANSQFPSRTVGDSREGLRQGLCAQ